MVEVWMLFSLLIPFVEVIMHTWMFYLQNRTEEIKENKISEEMMTDGKVLRTLFTVVSVFLDIYSFV